MSLEHRMETPDIHKQALTSNVYTTDTIANPGSVVFSSSHPADNEAPDVFFHAAARDDRVKALRQLNQQFAKPNQPQEKKTMPASQSQRRIVQVFIVDPDSRVPLKDAVLFEGEQQLTDLTDEELFFEVPIKDLLDKHNEMRIATVDKKATNKIGKDIFLDPARIRDLRMTIVDVAIF